MLAADRIDEIHEVVKSGSQLADEKKDEFKIGEFKRILELLN